MLKLKHLVVLLALATIAADCPFGDSSTDPQTDVVVGVWTLQSVNGDPLPANFADGEFTAVISAGSATVNANGTFSYSETWDSQVDVTAGTWTKDGSTYVFDPAEQGGEETQINGYATVSGSTMTLTVSEPGLSPTVRILTKN